MSLQRCHSVGYQKGPYEDNSVFTDFRLGGGDCFDLGQMKKRCVQRYCFETRN